MHTHSDYAVLYTVVVSNLHCSDSCVAHSRVSVHGCMLSLSASDSVPSMHSVLLSDPAKLYCDMVRLMDYILCVVVLLCVVLAQALHDPLWALIQTSNALELCHWGFRWTSSQISRAKVHTTSQVSVHL